MVVLQAARIVIKNTIKIDVALFVSWYKMFLLNWMKYFQWINFIDSSDVLYKQQLKEYCREIFFGYGKEKSNKDMINVWLYGFFKRWSEELASLTPRRLESTRAKATSPDIIENYYKNLQDKIEKYDLTDKPQHIYNIDETGITPDHRPPKVIAIPGSKPNQ